MTDPEAAARSVILSKLAQSRAELRQALDPVSETGEASADSRGAFPRSRTMRALMSSRGLSAIGAIVGGIFIARPAIALRLLRLLPASAISRALIGRLFGSKKPRE